MAEALVENVDQDEAIALFGTCDENLRLLRDSLGLKVVARHGVISVQGAKEHVDLGLKVLARMREQYRAQRPLRPDDVRFFLENERPRTPTDAGGASEMVGPTRRIRTLSLGQHHYVEAMRHHELTICIGPAGTGKTYLAVAAALEALAGRRVKRIVLVRPAVEAGEKLGFLPGDLQAKVHPFLRPLLDALRDMLDFQQVRAYQDNDVIEIAPLAYMRGRTLNEAFIILDEGQNTTVPQMKMFLTRMGMGSRIVVTGDVTQVDLPSGIPSGLDDVIERLSQLPRVAIVRLQKQDIVRHPLVQSIVEAYASASPNGE
jgi:phosphate starvation-inducible PhoH-like protein